MNIFKINIVILVTFTSILLAQESNETVRTLMIEKPSKSTYDRFQELFSDYDGTWMEDMFIYPVDMFMPDEMMRSVEDVFKNRKSVGNDSQAEHLPKRFGNDAYNIFMTNIYYYMQDVTQITKSAWNDELCDPSPFIYNKELEPKKVFLGLKEDDPNARGVTENSIVLPVNNNFPNAFYPYAQKPDGCTTEGLRDLYKQSNEISNDDKWLTEACNEHDRCYSTIGTTSQECNSRFIVDAIDACNEISNEKTLLSMGSKNAFCGFKGLIMATAANACAEKYFAKSQRQQKIYMEWVERYEKAYRQATAKQ